LITVFLKFSQFSSVFPGEGLNLTAKRIVTRNLETALR